MSQNNKALVAMRIISTSRETPRFDQPLIVQTKPNVSNLWFDNLEALGDTIQSNVSRHNSEALGTFDKLLRISYFLLWSKEISAAIIKFFKTNPFCKTCWTNDTSSENPWNPLNWIKDKWDTRQLGALDCGAHPKIGDCSCRPQKTWIRCNIHSNELIMLYSEWCIVQ